MLRARESGEGCQTRDRAVRRGGRDRLAAAARRGRAYERPESEVTGNAADDYERRAPGTGGMEAGVRYQYYATTDGYVLFMASEREFWKNFCEGVGRPDLFEKWPGSQYGDHARGNTELQRHPARRSSRRARSHEWLAFGLRAQHADRAGQHAARRSTTTRSSRTASRGMPAQTVGADMLPTPIKFVGEKLPIPTKAPTVGEHTEQVLRNVLGWSDEQIEAARAAGRVRSDRPELRI